MSEFKTIPLARIVESPTNPRKHFGDLEQLASSITEHGVLQPVLVRAINSTPPSFELVVGSRRYRASKIAKREDIPSLVVELDDAGVLEAQVIENNQRADVHPLEEADGFARLQLQHGYSVDTIAAKLGRSQTYVYQRLMLAKLCTKAREAFYAGDINATSALILARIPSEKLQAQALKELNQSRYDKTEPLPASRVREYVIRNFTLRLADAPFDTKDALLDAKAGACNACQKRTGAQVELFADFGKDDLCTDVACFRVKRDVGWKLRVAEAKKAGQRVLTDAEAKKVFPYAHGGIDYNCGFVKLTDAPYEYGSKSWKSLLGKECPPTILARDEDGNIHELVDKKAAHAVAKKKQPKSSTPAIDKSREKQRKEDDRKEAIAEATVAALIDKIEAKALTANGWRAIARAVVEDSAWVVCERRGWKTKNGIDRDSLKKFVEAASERELVAIVVESALGDSIGAYGDAKVAAALCKEFGIDKAAITSRLKDEAKKGKAA